MFPLTLCTFFKRRSNWLLVGYPWYNVSLFSILPLSCQDESGPTAEERQNNQNAGLEGEETRPESRPLLQETQPGMTKASPPLEDEDRGLGDSLPNTTSSSQTSLSALPTAASSGNTPHQSPTPFRLPPAAMVRGKAKIYQTFRSLEFHFLIESLIEYLYFLSCYRTILCSIDWCRYKVRFLQRPL